jgi:hypothetical protein
VKNLDFVQESNWVIALFIGNIIPLKRPFIGIIAKRSAQH